MGMAARSGPQTYRVGGWSRESDRHMEPRVFDPATDCHRCKGRGLVPNEELNRRRATGTKQYRPCPKCRS